MATVEEHLRRLASAIKHGNSTDLGCGALIQTSANQQFDDEEMSWQTDICPPTLPIAPLIEDEDKKVWQYVNGGLGGDYENAQKLLSHVSYDAQVLLLLKSEPGKRDRIFIGRGKRNDVMISNRSVSSVHLQLEPMDDDRAIIVDCRSSNGTFKNGTRLKPNQQEIVQSGDLLRMGECQYVYLGQDSLRMFLKLWLAEALSRQPGSPSGSGPRAG